MSSLTGRYSIFWIAFALFSLGLVMFSDSPASANSSRTLHRFGVVGSLLGEPYPSLLGANLAINLMSFLQVRGGYGVTPSLGARSFGGGVKLFVPAVDFSPAAGVHWTAVQKKSYPESRGQHLYASAGIDWQSERGFNIGVGYQYSPQSKSGLPYLQGGWFF